MTVYEETSQRLILKEPKRVYIFVGIIFLVIGGLPTLGLLFDSETPFYMAGLPFLVVLLGFVILKFYSHPDWAIFDKETGQVEVKKTTGFGGKYESASYPLANIVAVRLDRIRSQQHRMYALILTIDGVGKIPLCPHYNREKYRRNAAERARQFLGLESN